MRKTGKKGFTLTELIVVLVIMGIIAAIAVPLFTNYWRNAEFRKNEENAKTVYLAAESKLAYYRSSGQWESFQKQIKKQAERDHGKDPEERTVEEAVFPSDQEDAVQLNGRIYTLRLDKQATENNDNLLLQLIDDYMYDRDMLNASVAVEIDMESGEVYAAFYGSKCKGLTYEDTDKDGYLTMQKRGYDIRKKRLLGYYSAKDTVNVVSLKPTKLRITTISLQNSEKLTLNWSSNVGESLDVSYKIITYKSDGTPLFSMMLSPYDIRTNGWSGKDESSTSAFANVTLLDSKGQDRGQWSFPLVYKDNKYSLVLDAMMSAKTQAVLDSRAGTEEASLQRTLSTSICRLADLTDDGALGKPQDIYATVEAMSYAGTNEAVSVTREYRSSDAATSNTSNTMYADKTSGNDVKIATFRHLSNMRYFDRNAEATFKLTEKNMDWTSVGTGVYDLTDVSVGSNTVQKPAWKENSASETADFPTIALLPEMQTLEGNGKRTKISNVKLGEDSIVDDQTIERLNQAVSETKLKAASQMKPSEYLGLFGEIYGTVANVVIQDPSLSFGTEDQTSGSAAPAYSALKGVGILGGRSEGTVRDTDITTVVSGTATEQKKDTVNVVLGSAVTADKKQVAAVGGVIGILADTDNAGNLTALRSGKLENVTMEGSVNVQLPNVTEVADVADCENYALGAGGIIGYAYLESKNTDAVIESCENHAAVSGNYMTGGIVGMIDGSADSYEQNSWKTDAAVKDSSNNGLILCTADTVETLKGNYFGGIAGYAYRTLIYNTTSASGRASGFSYNKKKKDLLKGRYVGGIVGYGNYSLMANCGTESNGYILGGTYVGGIAGGLGGDVSHAIQAHLESVSVTTNRSYVVGSEYVGGIVGYNADGVELSNCINNGVVAGTEINGTGGRYVGGIVGYNASGASVNDCASYLSDYGNKIFDMIVSDWDARSDYVGGIAGYNNGQIQFTDESEAIVVKSVSSIVVGNNYVGGIAGFNDVHGTLNVNYTLIGGQIYAYENCAGGAFGFNASLDAAEQSLTVKPQSVQGRYFVGGVIGANVLNIPSDTTLSGLRSDNILGSITGEAFCGGVIGYQRTYADTQIPENSAENDPGIRASVDAAQKSGNDSEHILPGLEKDTNVPTAVVESANTNTLTITTSGNTETSLGVDSNNIPIRAVMYAGGVLGYCEKNSSVQIENCKNAGNITFASELVDSKDASAGTVRLGDYANSGEIPAILTSNAEKLELHFIGGITGVNLTKETIRNCTNTGALSGFTGIGGVVGLNAGTVRNCELSEHFGNAALEYVGGIVGINSNGGSIISCTTAAGKTISGNHHLGGIVGWNLTGGTLADNTNAATVSASGKDESGFAAVGGIAGQNSGEIQLAGQRDRSVYSVSGRNGSAVGGIAGINEADGKILNGGTTDANGESIVVTDGISVQGFEKVGGIVGINHGSLGNLSDNTYMTANAKLVQASHGNAGGIAGTTDGIICYAVNRCDSVSADAGNAGGIVAENTGTLIRNCKNYGNVRSSDGYVGGIAAANTGTIQFCRVNDAHTSTQTELYSLGVKSIGSIAATNQGVIADCLPGNHVVLRGNASVFGGIVGENSNVVSSTAASRTTAYNLSYMPEIDSSGSRITVGGAVGINTGTVSGIVATNLSFADFSGYQYLGGIVGENGVSVRQDGQSDQILVTDCSFSGTIQEKVNAGEAGNCYGGIAGINYAELSQNTIPQITMNIQGVYTATSSSTAAQKEAMASHAGGIVGKNETNALVHGCTIVDNVNSLLQAKYGMLGGIAGFNKGTVELSGSAITSKIMTAEHMTDAKTLAASAQNASEGNLSADTYPVDWYDGDSSYQIENSVYQGADGKASDQKISADRLNLKMTANGSIGGITAFNSTEGTLNACASGDWFILNRSEAIGVGTGGIIGMNESEKSLSCLVNGAFIGRQVSANRYHTDKPGEEGQTNRFAGGIIGNQNTSTGNEWTIEKCINFGTVYCYRAHYSGGIIGQWTSSGGTIRDCRNYGNLQTSLQYSWSGASGGIVAQLYYAYENNEYNIIGCENHGNLYMRKGAGLDEDSYGANDSAGILGNVTTYKVDSAEKGQDFTIRILDCVNGPGVEIYSSSMASGIFGFLSCDNVTSKNGSEVETSTQNVKMQVERCRNFAKVLQGRQFAGGIFGARYTTKGWSNTIISDCYSPDVYGYDPGKSPIYSTGNNHGGTAGDIADPNNRKNNFFINGMDEKKLEKDVGFYYNTFVLGKLDAQGNIIQNGVGRTNVPVTRKTTNTWNAYMSNIHALAVEQYTASNGTTNYRYAFAEIYSGCNSIGSDCFVDADGYIVDKNRNRIGQILFYTGDEDHKNHDHLYWSCTENRDLEHDEIYNQSRNSYRRLEGIVSVDGRNELVTPVKAEAKVANGNIEISVTPDVLPTDSEKNCDPFAYVVTVSDSNGNTAQRTIYYEKGSFAIPEGLSGTLSVSVRAKSMFTDVEDSAECTATVIQSGALLPGPEVRAELTVQQSVNDYRYVFSLDNLDAYRAYDGWQVTVYVNAFGKNNQVVLDEEHPTGVLNVAMQSKRNKTDNTYQIIAQATAKTGGYEDSTVVSTTAYMPYFQAFIGLKKATVSDDNPKNIATTEYTISGNTLDTLSVNISIDDNSAGEILEAAPIYRAELLGTWKGKKDVVFASTDIMTVSKGIATAQFSNLPEYLKDATDIHVRLWYSQTGLGPVYLYHDVATASEGNISELAGIDASGNEIWTYKYSLPLTNKWNDYVPYQDTSDTLFTWLPAPVMDEADGSSLIPEYDSDGQMQYTFSWDGSVSGTEQAGYAIALTGIDASGKEVTIDTGTYKGGKSFTIAAEGWNYTQVRLKVTRIGDASEKEIGLSTTATYKVAQRLEKPGQPSVTNIDNNELNYQVTWGKISDEMYCDGYQIYIRTYDAAGKAGKAEPVGTLQKAVGSATYSEVVNLESYAGKRILVYLVAMTGDPDMFVDSEAGVTYELQIPKRIAQPNVTWSVNWQYNTGNPMEADDFQSGGLRVALTADPSSIPPGGSAYLLRAYVYDSAEEAAKATASDPGTFISTYPEGDVPVQMNVSNAQNYYHVLQNLSIQYAGKWIVFYTRISSGAGNVSSLWTRSQQVFRLPYVKLNQPDVSVNTKEYQIAAKVQTTPNVPGSIQNWTAKHTVLEWNSVNCADMYTVQLEGQTNNQGSTDGTTAWNPQIRVLETTDNNGIRHVSVQQYVWKEIQNSSGKTEGNYIWETIVENQQTGITDQPETEKVHTWDISSYSIPVSSSYTAQSGALNYYTLTLTAQLEAQLQEDGSLHYTLKLPDVEQMTAADGKNVTYADFAVTDKAQFQANVRKNLEAIPSTAYAASDIYEIKWNH